MKNKWLDRANLMTEKEVILVRNSSETKNWYDKMPVILSVIYPESRPNRPDAFCPKVGLAHHLRYTRFGIEGVLKLPNKMQRLQFYVLHDRINQPHEPFWVILYK